MKKSVVIFITAVCLLITGCGSTGSLSKLPSSLFHEDKQKLTIMHIDADNKRFQDFIEETEKKLDMEITVENVHPMRIIGRQKYPRSWLRGTKILI